MMKSGYNQVSLNQELYPQALTDYWGGYQPPMQYPLTAESIMYPYPPQYPGGYMPPYQNGYQQVAYPPFHHIPHQGMPVGAFPANSVMQPMQQATQQIQKQPLSPFDNPLQPAKRPPQMLQQAYNPYPKQQFMYKQQPSGIKSVMNQFKTQDGSVDITKMMNTAGQMMNTVSQVSSMVKGVGGFFKV